MVKKTAYVCNRCGGEIRIRGSRIIPSYFDIKGLELVPNGEQIPEDDVHFCLKCTKEVLKEIARPAPQKAERKRVRIDTAKVMALHQAGWGNDEIADEMHVSQRQIYQCIRYQKEKFEPDRRAGRKGAGE
jgi:hypothetical protein